MRACWKREAGRGPRWKNRGQPRAGRGTSTGLETLALSPIGSEHPSTRFRAVTSACATRPSGVHKDALPVRTSTSSSVLTLSGSRNMRQRPNCAPCSHFSAETAAKLYTRSPRAPGFDIRAFRVLVLRKNASQSSELSCLWHWLQCQLIEGRFTPGAFAHDFLHVT